MRCNLSCVFLGSYVNVSQAQCLNCRALALHLDREKFTVGVRTVYSGDLEVESIRKLPRTKLFKFRYPARIWEPIQYLRGLLWCDIAYLPNPEHWRWAKWVLRVFGKAGFKTIEGAFIGTNLKKAVALEGSVEGVAKLMTYTGNTYSITHGMRAVNEKTVGIKTKDKVLYLGVETAMFANDVKREMLTDVVIIGSNLFYKGLDDFFDLARRFPNLKFHVVGSGMGKVDPAAEITKRGLKNVTAHGSLSHVQLAGLLKTIQLHVFPSRAEGFPKVTLETAAAGVPSLVYGDYGADEWITTGKNGFVVNTLDEMTTVIRNLLDHPEKLQLLADNARALARQFDWKVLVKDWEREIEGLAGCR